MKEYSFQSPFATAIHPTKGPDATLSLLHGISHSMPSSARLPEELLLHVNKEIHRENTVWREIRDTWGPVTEFLPEDFSYLGGSRFHSTKFNDQTKSYYISDEPFRWSHKITDIDAVIGNVSSADLLYRLRCFFPEVDIFAEGIDGYKTIWAAIIRHTLTGFNLLFTESKAGAQLWCGYDTQKSAFDTGDLKSQGVCLDDFSADSLRLLNILLETSNESSLGQFAYYHPAATADLQPTPNQRYIAVPSGPSRGRINHDTYDVAYDRWDLKDEDVSTSTSTFHSILQNLKYDINSRRIIDSSNSGANLTTVISSALLFYRLLCKYGDSSAIYHNTTTQESPEPITSVWRIELVHRETGICLVFMDDHGLFDIKVDGDTTGVMKDIEQLVEGLCSDVCTHPYDGVLAGCQA